MKPIRRTLVITMMTTGAFLESALAQPQVIHYYFQQSRRADEAYRQGTRALDDRNYERAIREFDGVIESKSARSDGAYYWKAYALNKQGKRDDALAALGEVAKQFPQSRWINDSKALEAEIKSAAGQGVSPENEPDEDLRLLAIGALINSQPERTIPLLEKVLNEPKNSPSLKTRALYVLAQSRSDKAREIVGKYAKNGSNPDLQLRAIEYLGVFRANDSRQVLADIYASSSEASVKRAVLSSYLVSRDTEHLLSAAKTEPNADLRREAIYQLGNVRALNELAQLYTTETSADLKETIIQAIGNGQGAEKLVEIAKSEKDARLRGVAISRLGTIRNNVLGDALVSIYQSESDKAIKNGIISALWQSGAAKQLVDLIRAEKDPDMKRRGVEMLSRMKSKEATDYLMELLSK